MKLTQVFVVSVLILVFSHGSNSQRLNRFIVDLVSNNDANRILCVGTVITERHVLAPATCVEGVERLTAVWRGTGEQVTGYGAERVFTYDGFRRDQPRGNNVAVVLLAASFNTTEFPPRRLSSLVNDAECQLFGWGETGEQNPRYERVRIRSPENCNTALPRAFCTRFEDSSPPACEARLGSPLVCGDAGTVSGFVVGSNEDCIREQDRTELYYHSVGQFQEWIERVSAAGKAGPVSVLVLSATLMALKNVL